MSDQIPESGESGAEHDAGAATAAVADAIALVQLASVTQDGQHMAGPDATTVGHDEIEAAIVTVANSRGIAGTAKLMLYAHLKPRSLPVSFMEILGSSLIDHSSWEPAAGKQVHQMVSGGVRQDPLGRNPSDLVHPAVPRSPGDVSLMTSPTSDFSILLPEIQGTMVGFTPMCEAKRSSFKGRPVMHISTDCYSVQPIEKFEHLINPPSWPDCPVQHLFFKSMDPVDGREHSPLPAPDTGWTGLLTEVVDFGFGMGMHGMKGEMETQLEVEFVDDSAASGVMASTYRLHKSIGDKVNHDQGYLCVQDMKATNLRRFTTMKAVWFDDEAANLPADQICPTWTLASALLMYACVDHQHPGPR